MTKVTEVSRKTRLTFIGFDEKRLFIKENAIHESRIYSETPGSIVLLESVTAIPVNWEANGFVYSTEVL